MNRCRTKTMFVWTCVFSVCCALGSCASPLPTKQFLISPLIAPADTARIVFSRSSGPGWMTPLFVLSSPGAVAQASQGKPNEPVEYCRGGGIKVPLVLDFATPLDARCEIPIDTTTRLILLDEDKVHMVPMRCDVSQSRVVSMVGSLPVRYSTLALAPKLRRSCVKGAEIGTVASGEQLEWLVEAGPLTVTIYPWLLSVTLQAEAGRVHHVHFEYAINSMFVKKQQ